MRYDYDVVIVGAGPAGSSCAKTLAADGLSTLLIDKHAFPRIKSCCGFLTTRALDFIGSRYGNLPDDLFCSNRNIEALWTASGRNFNKLEGYTLANIYRDKFDQWLARESKARFVDGCECRDIVAGDDSVTVTCQKAGEEQAIKCRCRYLVCAAGANSVIRKSLDSSYRPDRAGASIQKVYRGTFNADKNYYYVALNKKYTDELFSYFYFKDDLAFIGNGWTKKDNGYFEKWFEFLKDRYSFDLEQIRDERCCIEHNLGGNGWFPGRGRALFVGEAAGLIEKLEIGIPTALISGEMAALALLEGGDVVAGYDRKMSDELEFLKKTQGK